MLATLSALTFQFSPIMFDIYEKGYPAGFHDMFVCNGFNVSKRIKANYFNKKT